MERNCSLWFFYPPNVPMEHNFQDDMIYLITFRVPSERVVGRKGEKQSGRSIGTFGDKGALTRLIRIN